MSSKIKIWSATVALALGLPTAANAVITIDPDGVGGGGAIVVGTLDWAPTSFLAQNGSQAIANFINSQALGVPCGSACDFTVITQARLQAFQDTGGNNISGTGLGTAYQWTMVAKFTETVVAATFNPVLNLGSANFSLKQPNDPANFVEVFYDTASNQSQLTGAGFNDGTLILKGTVATQQQPGTLTTTTPLGCDPLTGTGCPALDQNGANDYTGQTTILATGTNPALFLTASSITADGDFFLADPGTIDLIYQDISQNAPFFGIDPMTCFDTTVSGLAVGASTVSPVNCQAQGHLNLPYSGQVLGVNGGYIPNTGPVNGGGTTTLLGFVTSGPDDVFKTDFNSPINGVPEPGSLALLGAVLGAAGFIGRRRRTQN